jgi:hypothetical protein
MVSTLVGGLLSLGTWCVLHSFDNSQQSSFLVSGPPLLAEQCALVTGEAVEACLSGTAAVLSALQWNAALVARLLHLPANVL